MGRDGEEMRCNKGSDEEETRGKGGYTYLRSPEAPVRCAPCALVARWRGVIAGRRTGVRVLQSEAASGGPCALSSVARAVMRAVRARGPW